MRLSGPSLSSLSWCICSDCFSSSIILFLKDEIEVYANSCLGAALTFWILPVLILAIPRSIPLDSICLPVMFNCLFLVTSLGVPQSITLLNLLSIGLSSLACLVIACVSSAFFLVWGAKRDFLSSAILFCFSVSWGSLLFSASPTGLFPLAYSWACLYLGLF